MPSSPDGTSARRRRTRGEAVPEGPAPPPVVDDELGAHVSAAGGVARAPARATDVASRNLQLFTKQPSRWAEPELPPEVAADFRNERKTHGVRAAGAHDSYLINLASPDPVLRDRSRRSFEAELARCRSLGLDFVVTHPGNATDGDLTSGIVRNGEALEAALEAVWGGPRVLLEITAGSGTTVGASFEGLAAILDVLSAGNRSRVGICFDTCHAYSAGYDLVGGYDGVWRNFDDVLGLDRLGLFHLNDSKTPFASRRDRHEHIGEGSLGPGPFRRIMTDARFVHIPKLLETPKGDDLVSNDRRNLGLLRSFRRGA